MTHIELGCGSAPPAGSFSGVPIGVDVDVEALNDLRRTSPHSIAVCADAMSLPFRTASAESISLRAVLHHLLPLDAALDELARVLAAGAVMSVVDGVALGREEVESLEAELRDAGLEGEPSYGFDVEELTARLRQRDLIVDRVDLDGTATFATPPFVSRPYTSDRFHLTARRAPAASHRPDPTPR